MPHSGNKSRRHRSSAKQFFAPSTPAPATPWLVAATDLGLLAALWLVPLCLGGRLAIGQGVLVAAAVWSAACWSLHQFIARDSRWIWTRCEWLWVAAVGLVVLQFTALPEEWLEWLSPQHAEVLSEWAESPDGSVMSRRWSTLSFVPQETRSSLATFLAYGLLFFVAVQRFREQRDIERVLKWIVAVTVSIAVFALVQYAFSNGKFFGVFQHPFSDPTACPLGPFTNRNHLAQFLVLGLGPLWWWWLTATQHDQSSSKAKGSSHSQTFGSAPTTAVHLLAMAALTIIVLTVLLSQSRGGVLALAVAGLVGLWGFHRAKLVSPQFVLGLLTAMVAIGGIGWVAGSQELARRIDSSGAEARWPVWQANIDLVRHFPWVGTGVGTHVHSHQLFLDRAYTRREYTHADNSYLQVASECGMAGAGIGGVMLLTCCGWGWGVLRRRTDTSSTAIAAAIAASLSANAVHAVFDFLWFVPGLMVVVLLLAASARRLSQLDLVAGGLTTPELPVPRLCWGLTGCGLVLLAPWMWAQKADAIVAEPHRIRFQNLVFVPDKVFPVDEEPETLATLRKEKALSAVRAAKADRRDGHIQLNAALAYRQMFDLQQERSENPMTLALLRDAVQASGFTSKEELREWFDRATGKNARLLDAAWKCAIRSVEESPLEGDAYVCLAELSFLQDPSGKLQERLLKQALEVRPYDPNVLFAAGQEELLLGHEAEGLALWKRAFGYASSFQKRIADILVIDKSAEFLCETFAPNWQAKGHICDSFRKVDRPEELRKMLRYYAEAAAEHARQQTIDDAAAQGWIAARTAWLELKQPQRAIAGLQEGVKQHPHSMELRVALGTDLFHQERYVEAADHLRWAAGRNPDNAALQDLAKEAIRASLKSEPTAHRIAPAAFER